MLQENPHQDRGEAVSAHQKSLEIDAVELREYADQRVPGGDATHRRRGRLYSVSEESKNNTGGGEGIQILENRPYENEQISDERLKKGQYTKKIFHLASKVPRLISTLLPRGSLQLQEESWNSYPYSKTILTNPGFMEERFTVVIETLHHPDNGTTENIHKLPRDLLNKREVVVIDIANDEVGGVYDENDDPKKVTSLKGARGPLIGDWMKTVQPVMTCYKLVKAEFKSFAMQSVIENLIMRTERRVFTVFHRKVYCSMDRWYGLTLSDIRKLEEETKRELDRLRNRGTVRGLKMDDV